MGTRLDTSVMFAIHRALRRDLEQVARIAVRQDGSAARSLAAVIGWEQFKKFLIIHHQVEDDALWPALREAVDGYPDQAALVDALEEEHAVIEPLLEAIDEAVRDPGDCYRSLGDIVDELVSHLGGHLAHEEGEGLDLIDASLSVEAWQRFSQVHGQRLLGDAPTYVPWLLEGADLGSAESFLARIPPPLAAAYREQWAPAYASLTRWGPSDNVLAPDRAEN
jgi:hypothetical protein